MANVTRQNLLDQIANSIGMQNNYSIQGQNSTDWRRASEMNSNAIREKHYGNQLKDMLGLLGPDDNASGSGASWSNPFGGAGASGAGGAGAPQFSNADNRFATGLTDAESRLRALLDNPDSINQSGAYKFRVKQGEEALQRQMGAKGMLNSGNRLQELTKYGQEMAGQEYDNQYGRLGSLLGNYTQGYTADKNANVNLYGQQANAFNQAQGNQDRMTIANNDIWSKRNPVPIPGISGGMKWVG